MRSPTPREISLAAGAAAAAIYLSFPAARYNFDGVACAIAVELGDQKHLVHGNHLAYAALGYFFFRGLRALRLALPALQSLQIFSSLLGAAGIGGFAWLLLECGVSPLVALFGAIGLAVSKIYWIWSLEAQVFPLGAAFLMFAAAEAFRKKPDPVRLGLLHAGAVLGHVGHLMFFPAAVYLLGSRSPSPTPRDKKRAVALYAAALILAVAAAYALAAFWVQPKSLGDLRIWLLGSAALAVDRSFGWHGGYSWQGLLSWLRISFEMAGIGFWGGVALIGAAGLGGWRRWKKDRRIVIGSLLWLAGYAALFLSWEPYTPDYRITDLAPLWLLACMGLETLRWPLRARAAAIGLAVLVLGACNFESDILPASRPENNADLQRALWIARETPPDAWIIADGIDQVYIPYFAGRSFINLRYYSGRPELLNARIESIQSMKADVFAVPEILPSPWNDWTDRRGLKGVAWKNGWSLVRLLRKGELDKRAKNFSGFRNLFRQ